MISEEQEFQICRVKKKKRKKIQIDGVVDFISFFSQVSTLSYSATTWKKHQNELIGNNDFLIGFKYYS